MYTNDFDEYDAVDEPVFKKKKKLIQRQLKKKEVEDDIFDESETSHKEIDMLSQIPSDEEIELNESMQKGFIEVEENDPLDEIIPYMESIQEGIYEAKITSIKITKNDKVMVCFNLNVDNQFYYPIFEFFPRTCIKGNSTYLLLKAFDNKRTSFNSLIKKSIIVSVKIVKKDGKIYENLVDYASEEYEISTLEVDKYGRFIF